MVNYSVYILLSFLLLTTLSCEDEKEKEVERGTFSYFSNDISERQFKYGSNNGFYITLPTSYNVNSYLNFSITNADNYNDQDNSSFFSVDHFTQEDISYYEKYFADSLKTSSQDNLELMLNYALNSRASNLKLCTTSIISTITTKSGINMKVAAVKGSENNYRNPLYYQYGIFELDKEIYLIQFIVNEEDISFFHGDILTVFKSVREI